MARLPGAHALSRGKLQNARQRRIQFFHKRLQRFAGNRPVFPFLPFIGKKRGDSPLQIIAHPANQVFIGLRLQSPKRENSSCAPLLLGCDARWNFIT